MPALSPDDIQRMMGRSSGRGHTGGRNRALVAAFAGAGLGVSEALALTAVDLDEGAAMVRVGGPRSRSVPVDPAVMRILTEWAEERRRLGLLTGPLFCTRDGLPLEASYVRRLIARLGREAGVHGVVNARALRESYAAAHMSAGASAEELSARLGHASVASTQRFVRQLGQAAQEVQGMPNEVVDALLAAAHAGLTVVRAVRAADGGVEDFVMEYLNPMAATMLGGTVESLRGRSVRLSFPNAPTDGTYARWMDLIERQGAAAGDRHTESEGRARQFRVRRKALGDRIVMSFEDLSGARASERMLGLLEARQLALLDACHAGILVMEPNLTIAGANAAAERIFALPLSRLIGRTPLDPRWRPVDVGGTPIATAELPVVITQTTGRAIRGAEMCMRRGDGRSVSLSVNAEAVDWAGGPPFGVVVSVTDLAEVRAAEARARSAEATAALVQQLTGTIVMRCGPDGAVQGLSGALDGLLGYRADELVEPHCEDFVDPGDRPAMRQAFLRALDSDEVVELDHAALHRDGSRVPVTRGVWAVREPSTGDVEEVQSVMRRRDAPPEEGSAAR